MPRLMIGVHILFCRYGPRWLKVAGRLGFNHRCVSIRQWSVGMSALMQSGRQRGELLLPAVTGRKKIQSFHSSQSRVETRWGVEGWSVRKISGQNTIIYSGPFLSQACSTPQFISWDIFQLLKRLARHTHEEQHLPMFSPLFAASSCPIF